MRQTWPLPPRAVAGLPTVSCPVVTPSFSAWFHPATGDGYGGGVDDDGG